MKPSQALALVGTAVGVATLVMAISSQRKARAEAPASVDLLAGETYAFRGRIVPRLTGANLDAFIEQLSASQGAQDVQVETRGNTTHFEFQRQPPVSTVGRRGKIGTFLGTSVFIDSIRRMS